MADFIEERCIGAMAESVPYAAGEISRVFERCGSIDKTIEVLRNANRLKRPLMQVCKLMNI